VIEMNDIRGFFFVSTQNHGRGGCYRADVLIKAMNTIIPAENLMMASIYIIIFRSFFVKSFSAEIKVFRTFSG